VALAVEHVHHFAMGSWLVIFAYLTSVVGSIVGLASAMQARLAADQRSRIGWLVLAAVSIGGVAIWLMHFIAMLGFDTPGMPVRYDIGRTVLSAVLSVGAVFLGLLVFGARARFSWWRLLVAGLITGLAVNLMHYTGMWALNIKGSFSYDTGLVLASIAIAVVAATAAFWFTVVVDRMWLRVVAGLVMGLAVTGMHFMGMAAVRVEMDPAAPEPAGVEVFSFLFPVFVVAIIALAVPIYAVLMAATWSDTDTVPEYRDPRTTRVADARVGPRRY
jgi:NO-binding membrane sensor protein with MHYT domain